MAAEYFFFFYQFRKSEVTGKGCGGGTFALLLDGLSVETCSLSLTVLPRVGRREMEAITSTSS